MSIESKKKKILVLIIKNKNLSYKNILIKKNIFKIFNQKKNEKKFSKTRKSKKGKIKNIKIKNRM